MAISERLNPGGALSGLASGIGHAASGYLGGDGREAQRIQDRFRNYNKRILLVANFALVGTDAEQKAAIAQEVAQTMADNTLIHTDETPEYVAIVPTAVEGADQPLEAAGHVKEAVAGLQDVTAKVLEPGVVVPSEDLREQKLKPYALLGSVVTAVEADLREFSGVTPTRTTIVLPMESYLAHRMFGPTHFTPNHLRPRRAGEARVLSLHSGPTPDTNYWAPIVPSRDDGIENNVPTGRFKRGDERLVPTP